MCKLTVMYVRDVLNANGRYAGAEVPLHHLETDIRTTGIDYNEDELATVLEVGKIQGYWKFIRCSVLQVPALQILK
ncbi:hypothetical protein [Dyella sp. 2HG41-7]|uniref:hypothetical protein n=1 Tax=Dyella sp. 2HG41-7 TaxID=2883239 RepID=UPI001F286D99|nr:hypothetical protein [Dyella sp. 2HG41-7]